VRRKPVRVKGKVEVRKKEKDLRIQRSGPEADCRVSGSPYPVPLSSLSLPISLSLSLSLATACNWHPAVV